MMRIAPALWPLLVLALMHALVDTFAMFLQPLWPDLAREFAVGEDSVQWSYVSWSLATSAGQLFFGYWGDRFQGAWLIWAGPLLGMMCVGSIGLIDSLWALNCVLFIGGLGVAAFHPEAAAMAGSCLPASRSRAMSIFAVGGSIGQAIGPIYSGIVSTRYNLPALAWSIGWGVMLLVLLSLALRNKRANAQRAVGEVARPRQRSERVTLGELLRRRGRVLGLILLIGTFRVLPVMGLPLALAYMIKNAGGTNETIGWMQAVFLSAIGLGGLACAGLLGGRHERTVLWLLPLLVSPALASCALTSGWLLVMCVCAAGLLLGFAMPVLIGYGQQLLPEAQRLASSITMGVTWGLGAAVVQGVIASTTPARAILVFAAATLGSSLLCALLPKTETAAETPASPRTAASVATST